MNFDLTPEFEGVKSPRDLPGAEPGRKGEMMTSNATVQTGNGKPIRCQVFYKGMLLKKLHYLAEFGLNNRQWIEAECFTFDDPQTVRLLKWDPRWQGG